MTSPLKVYGVFASQPVRSVLWVCAMKQLPYDLIQTVPGKKDKNGSRDPDFVKNVAFTGAVSAIDDNGFKLFESNAISPYLCDKHGWDDFYPKDLQKRAKIDQFLHWHHGGPRKFTIGLFAPLMRKDKTFTPDDISNNVKISKISAKQLDSVLSETGAFLCGQQVTIADIAIYGDIGQFTKRFDLGLFDFTPYPALSAWTDRMAQLPGHNDVHRIMKKVKVIFDKERGVQSKL